MTSQGIMSSVANKLFGSMYCAEPATSCKNPNTSEKTASSFEGMIKQSRTKTEYRYTEKISSESTEQRKNADAVKAAGPNKAERKDDTGTEAAGTEKVENDKRFDLPEEDKNIEAMVTNLVQVIENIISILQDTLEIDTGEINTIMNDMGIDFMDLLNQDNLKQFSVFSLCQGDITAALTDEDIADKLYSVLEQVQEIISDFETTVMDVESAAIYAEQTEIPLELTDRLNQMLVYDETKSFSEISNQADETDEETLLTPDMTGEAVTDTAMMNLEIGSTGSDNADDSGNWSSDSDLPHENRVGSKQADSRMISVNEFIENLVEVRLSGDNLVSSELTQNVSFRDIAYQVIEQVKVTVADGQTHMQMVLSPESLGRVELNIVSKDGVMTAQLSTQTQLAKEAIESQIVILQESLNNQGLKVEAIEVTVSDFYFGQSDETDKQYSDSKKGHRSSFKGEGIVTEEPVMGDDSLIDSVMELNGHTVSYTA